MKSPKWEFNNIRNIIKNPLPCVYHDKYSVQPWPTSHRFRMPKFKLLYESLLNNGFNFDNMSTPILPTMDDILTTHDKEYISRLHSNDRDIFKEINLPYSEWLLERSGLAINGTLLTCQLAMKHGIACHLAGGTHHAKREKGSGFCLYNDIAYSAINLLSTNEFMGKNILILDFDVHQGDGTASILSNMDNAFTVSMHCKKNYPFKKEVSNIDIELDDKLNDIIYLDKVKTLVGYLCERHISGTYPISLVIYDNGVDVHINDMLGRLNITDDGIYKRDRFVMDTFVKLGIPIACVIGGGYDESDIVLAQRHSILHWSALETWNQYLM